MENNIRTLTRKLGLFFSALGIDFRTGKNPSRRASRAPRRFRRAENRSHGPKKTPRLRARYEITISS